MSSIIYGNYIYKSLFEPLVEADSLQDTDLFVVERTNSYPNSKLKISWADIKSQVGGGGSQVVSIDDLSDVDTSSIPPQTDDVLAWDGSQWVPAELGSIVVDISIDSLDDVDTVSNPASVDDVLAWDGSNWVPDTLATVARSGAYSDLSGTPSLATVATTGAYSDLSGTPSLATVATTGDYGDLSNTPSIPSSIDDLSDVDTSTVAPTTGQALIWDGSQWVPDDVASGGISAVVEDTSPQLGGNLDAQSSYKVVNLVDPTNAQDAATKAYVDANVFSGAYGDLTGAPSLATVATSGDYGDLSNTPSIPSSIDDLSDVDTSSSSPTSGQALVWDGSQWVPDTIATDLVDDTSPQLGGDLDLNGFAITAEGDDYIAIVQGQNTAGTGGIIFANQSSGGIQFQDVGGGTLGFVSTAGISMSAPFVTLGTPGADIYTNTNRIQNVGDPTNAQDAATKAYVDSLNSFGIQFTLPLGENGTYAIDQYASFAYTIESAYFVTSSGTVSASVEIDGTPVTGLTGLSLSSSQDTETATAANSVSAGDAVSIVLSSNSSAEGVSIKLTCARS